MKSQNLLCYATLAFVDRRIGTRRCGNRYSCCRVGKRVQPLSNGDNHEHTNIRLASENGDNNLLEHSQKNRRLFFQTISKSFMTSMLMIPMNAKPARAACLSGDIRAECIGVYKLPIDAAESPFVETPEKLKIYAPDLLWVPPVEYPPNYSLALKQLKEQRQQLDVARDLVASGDIEKTGLVYLDIIPKVSAAGIVICKAFGNAANKERNAAMKAIRKSGGSGNDGNPSSTLKATTLELRLYRVDYALNELNAILGSTDILIGQGLRGDLGASAPAQIEILSDIAEGRKEFDNFLRTVPEKPPR